jgi:hypothetical protein
MSTSPTTVLVGDTTYAGLGLDLATGDVNHDGKDDIIALGYNQLSSYGAEQYYCFSVFLGDSLFQLKRNYYVDSRNVPGGFGDNVACFDADGYDDILVSGLGLLKGGTRLDTLPTYYISPPDSGVIYLGSYPWVGGGGNSMATE